MATASPDVRAFDGPYDKEISRRSQREIVQTILQGRDLAIRVPGHADPDDEAANRGKLEELEAQPGDTGCRWRHTFNVSHNVEEVQPVSFDAGSCALWVTPGGWRCLLCWQHDDPTHGLNVAVFDPWGKMRASILGADGYSAVDFVRERMP